VKTFLSALGWSLFAGWLAGCAGVAESVSPASFRHHPAFASTNVAPRTVDVWLPPGYATQPHARYPVVYLHDGQNLFDGKTSTFGTAWAVDAAMLRLLAEQRVRPAILVGIWNTPRRLEEYLPAKMLTEARGTAKHELALRQISERGRKLVRAEDFVSDAYLKFLVTELKPFVDRAYRTRPGRGDTFVMGSSAGALVSLYAVCEYPGVFGGAGCVSTHLPVGDGLMVDYAARHLPPPRGHKFYFDFGTETLDQDYEPYQQRLDAVLAAHGYERGGNWVTKKFPGEEHSERSWRKRVHEPLEFLLGK
jgi:predicted alpha/beta superfamily hydrolase